MEKGNGRTIVDYGVDLLDVVAGGHLAESAVNWLNERTAQIRPMMSSAANSFFEQARNMHQMISTSDAIQALRNLTFKKDNLYEANQIHRINNIEGFQTANPINQRWIMAHTPIRELYLANSLEGYGDSYNNVHGNTIGEDNYDYRRVMSGVMTPVVESDSIKTFYEPLKENDEALTLHQKVDIINNWNLLNNLLDEGELDPTSPVGNLLG